MATRLNTTQILDETVGRADLNATTTGKAVVKKIVQGTNITLSSTGVDSGTGDVTISLPSFPWASISGKPTTLNGYGITDGLNKYMSPVTNTQIGSPPYGYPLTRPLHTDPEFNTGYNNLGVYNNSSADGVLYSIITDSQAPNRTKKVLKVESFTGKLQSPGLGGVVPYGFTPTYNTQYIEVFVAKIPVGYYIQGASNSIGPDADTNIWLTSQFGTGKWETYVRLISAGSSGSFGTTGHIFIQPMSGQTSVVWYMSYFNVFMLNVDDSSYISSDQLASVDWAKLINKPTTAAGYGITDVYTKTQIDQMGVTPPVIKSAKLLAPKWYKLFRLNNFQNDFNSAGESVNAVFRILGQSDFGRTADVQTSFIEGSFGMRGESFKPILTSKGDLALGQGTNRYQFQVFIEDGFAYLYMRTPTYSECVIEYAGNAMAYITPVADITFNNTTGQFDVPVPSTGTKYWDSADPTSTYQGMYVGNNPVAVQNTSVVFSRLNIASNNYFLGVRNPNSPISYLDALWDSSSTITVDTNASLEVSAAAVNFSADVGIYGKLSIADTALVTNLNADMLDSQHSSFYLNSNNHTRILTDSNLTFNTATLPSFSSTIGATTDGKLNIYSSSKIYISSAGNFDFYSAAVIGMSGASVNITATNVISIGVPGNLSQAPFSTNNTGVVTNLNADKLDGQDGSYYLNWTNLTNKPTQTGFAGQLYYNKDGNNFDGVANTFVDATTKMLSLYNVNPTISLPSGLTFGYVTPYPRKKANFGSLGVLIGGSNYNKSVQFSIDEDMLLMVPSFNSTTPTSIGFGPWSTLGTPTARATSISSPVHRAKRLGLVSAATAGALSGYRQTTPNFYTGSGTNKVGGFFFIGRFAQTNAAAVGGERFFFGVTGNTSAPTNVEPSTLTQTVGIAALSSDPNQYYLIAAGTTAQAAIPLGASLGVPGRALGPNSEIIELALFAPSGATNTIYVEVTNVTTGATYTTSLLNVNNAPSSSLGLMPSSWKSNNTTALAASYDIIYMKAYVNT